MKQEPIREPHPIEPSRQEPPDTPPSQKEPPIDEPSRKDPDPPDPLILAPVVKLWQNYRAGSCLIGEEIL